jgi:flavin reductase (DIM6/NTAB) family NADH-FMN oxidoreductase RutF
MKLETGNPDRQELHELIGSAMAPLLIAFVSTVDPNGIYNVAPFSFAAPICTKPPIICIAIGLRLGQKKDTLKNIEFSHDFVINTVDESMIKQTVQASADYPYGIDEIKETGLTAVLSEKVKAPRVAEAKISLECRLVQKLELIEEYKDTTGLKDIIFGEVVLAHINDDVWIDGKIDPRRLKLIGRIGSNLYCKPGEIFEMIAPKI